MKFLFTFLTLLCLVFVACEQDCTKDGEDRAVPGDDTTDVVESTDSEAPGDTTEAVDDTAAPEEDAEAETDVEPTEGDTETTDDNPDTDAEPEPEETDDEEPGDPTGFQNTQHRFNTPTPGASPGEDD